MTFSSPPRELHRVESHITPQATYKFSDVTVRLYKAKDMYKRKWNHPDLKKVTLLCRKTFLRYGNRALLDKFDDKACIYLACATYPVLGSDGRNYFVSEWLSSRLVPGDGLPLGCGELELYRFQGKRLDKVVRDRIFGGQKDFYKHIVSGSRICGINPYYRDGFGPIESLPTKNLYTAACFALIFDRLHHECKSEHTHLTGVIQNKFICGKLSVVYQGDLVKPILVPAYEFLEIENNRDIKLDRKVYAYRFPSYWLNMDQLLELLELLLKEGSLSERSFRHYLGTKNSFEEAIRGHELSQLGKILSVRGRIKWSQMTGAELRRLINEHVEDQPELKIVEVDQWLRSLWGILAVLNVSRM